MNYDRPELIDRLASEYVLGTLHGQARARFERLLRSNIKIRIAVEDWERRLMPMGAAVPDAPTPSAALWRGIETRIAPAARGPAAKESLFARWFGLRSLAQLAAGIAIGAVAVMLVPNLDQVERVAVPKGRVVPEQYAGFLAGADGQQTLLIASRRNEPLVDLKWLREINVPADHNLQLWALIPGAEPVALGVIPAAGKPQIKMADTSEKLLSKATELAVSAEPKAAVPAARPSGPYILRGPCAKFW